jgi:hypothetical protein
MFKIRDPITKFKISALISGMAGVMLASYGNALLGGMPNSFIILCFNGNYVESRNFEEPIIEKESALITL